MDAKLVKRLSIWSIGGTTLVFTLAMVSLFIYRRDQLVEDASRHAKYNLYMASNLIGDRLEIAKTAVINSALPEEKGDSRRIVENLLRNNSDIYGTAIAMTPEFAEERCGRNRYMIYSYRTAADTLRTFMISDSIEHYYHYPERDWYRYPVEHKVAHWSEPYYDTLTSGELMVSYSAPIETEDSTVRGVLLADITLGEGISRIVKEVDSVDDHRTFLLSRKGNLVFGDTTGMWADMVYIEKMPETEWTLGHIMNKDALFRPLRNEVIHMTVLFLVTVLILGFTIYYTISRTTRPAVKRQMRIKAELDVAARIQAGMLPKRGMFSAERKDLDVATLMHPAKEVGGDFYNYFVEGDRMYFIIGDVSGKGVPAALIMAIATELFLVSAPGKKDPSEVVESINRALSRDNDESMFVTMIVGVLDTATGKLRLCNAGHNLPILVWEDGERVLRMESNVPVGIIGDYAYSSEEFDFGVERKLVLYTDGVTEAENSVREQFGDARLIDVLRMERSLDAAGMCNGIEAAVREFASGFEQSDDITIFVLDYKGKGEVIGASVNAGRGKGRGR